MFTAFKIFRDQVRNFKNKGLTGSPYKNFFKWRRALAAGANSVRDELPWITFDCISYLENYLKKGSRVFEYGGGGSTLFFLKHGAEVHTVEHDEGWFKTLGETIQKKKYPGWKGHFIKGEKGTYVSDPDTSDPSHYATADETYITCNFKAYATVIDQYPAEYFDVVLVDGRSRPSCIHHAIPKIKKNGLLVLDNSDRDYYLKKVSSEIEKQFTKVISGYAPSPYYREFTHTTIWIKNK